MSRHQELAEAGNAAVVEPWVDALRVLIQRAIDRSEVSASADVEAISRVIPSMAAYRVFIERTMLDRDFLVSLIDGVVLPALRPGPVGAEPAPMSPKYPTSRSP